MGGYIAVRLRTKWTAIHGDEVYFRDTAYGFLAWSVALVVTAAFLATAAASLTSSSVSGNVRDGKSEIQNSSSYFVDQLIRSQEIKQDAVSTSNTEIAVIFAHALEIGELSQGDQQYLSQVISARTGLSHSEADKRVADIFVNARQSAEGIRKAIAHSLLWLFVALLIGAFCASVAATIGGRQRDNVVLI
jgi:hypothetical protein